MHSNGARYPGQVIAVLAILTWSRPAFAYIDPGITALLAQGLFTFIFGTVAAWILAPWRFLKRLFGSNKKTLSEKVRPDETDEPSAP